MRISQGEYRKCLSLLKSILGPSLQSLAMRLAFIEDAVPLEPRFFAQILGQIGISCTGLRKLDISIPNFRESSVDAVTEALNDISFPSLRILQITHAGGWLDDSSSVDFSQFFLRHPHLDQLLYLAPQSIPSDALSCLTKFEGTLAHCVEICRGGVRPIKRLSVVQLHGALDDDEATSLVGALQESKEVRSLSFFECLGTSDDGWRAKGLSLDAVKRIAEACPKLTHIEFHVPCYESLDRYYKEITDGLSHLEFMKLTIYRGFVTQKYGSGIFSFSNPTGVSSSLPSSSGLLKDGEKKGCKERMVELEVERVAESLVPFLSSLKMVHLRLFGWDCCMACNTPPNWQEDFFFEVIRPSSGPVLQYSWVD
ncbi:hypothetical protein BT96DRAFT_306187 [Gymnopus androsaceus JB14]|uniref:F-box domain-containing protein n=1 Tax=Gymnopus androsaceus JB14 TaxID=1447944 RepID=A0A6A4I9T5_9AGAR|nr:hypothetical protein BT96DRAFT_306187 [Gymnopus androsaceus JB14]